MVRNHSQITAERDDILELLKQGTMTAREMGESLKVSERLAYRWALSLNKSGLIKRRRLLNRPYCPTGFTLV